MTEQSEARIPRAPSALLKVLINGTVWSFIGVLLTVAFFYLQQYRNPFDFEITIDDEVNLVQVRDRIADLEIRYKNEDILNTPKVLKVLRVTLRNLGQTILQSQYDQNEDFGLDFSNAEVLDTAVTDSNADYLKTHLLLGQSVEPISGTNEVVATTQVGRLRLAKVIFEKGKFATLKVFLLQQQNEPVKMTASGKIANIDNLTVKRAEPGQQKQQATKTGIIAFVAAYAGIIAGMLSLSAYLQAKYARERKRKLRAFLDSHKDLNPEENAIVAAYRYRWSSSLSLIVRRLAAGDDVLNLHDHFRKEIASLRRDPTKFMLMPRFLRRLFEPTGIPKEVFIRDGITIRFNPKNEKFIREFFAAVGSIPAGKGMGKGNEGMGSHLDRLSENVASKRK